MKWLDVLKVIGPAALAAVPGAAPFIPLIVAGIQVAEMSGKPGVEKKEMAKAIVKIGAEATNTAAKKEIINPTDAVKLANDTIDIVVKAVNAATEEDKPK
jgi:predicted Mrr-cat superfamily restriction endonuclease